MAPSIGVFFLLFVLFLILVIGKIFLTFVGVLYYAAADVFTKGASICKLVYEKGLWLCVQSMN